MIQKTFLKPPLMIHTVQNIKFLNNNYCFLIVYISISLREDKTLTVVIFRSTNWNEKFWDI